MARLLIALTFVASLLGLAACDPITLVKVGSTVVAGHVMTSGEAEVEITARPLGASEEANLATALRQTNRIIVLNAGGTDRDHYDAISGLQVTHTSANLELSTNGGRKKVKELARAKRGIAIWPRFGRVTNQLSGNREFTAFVSDGQNIWSLDGEVKKGGFKAISPEPEQQETALHHYLANRINKIRNGTEIETTATESDESQQSAQSDCPEEDGVEGAINSASDAIGSVLGEEKADDNCNS